MLDVGFVDKANILKPRPNFLYLEAQMSGRNVSWIDKGAMHDFMSIKSHKEVGACRCVKWVAHQYAVWK
jgi:hypothetical protein